MIFTKTFFSTLYTGEVKGVVPCTILCNTVSDLFRTYLLRTRTIRLVQKYVLNVVII